MYAQASLSDLMGKIKVPITQRSTAKDNDDWDVEDDESKKRKAQLAAVKAREDKAREEREAKATEDKAKPEPQPQPNTSGSNATSSSNNTNNPQGQHSTQANNHSGNKPPRAKFSIPTSAGSVPLSQQRAVPTGPMPSATPQPLRYIHNGVDITEAVMLKHQEKETERNKIILGPDRLKANFLRVWEADNGFVDEKERLKIAVKEVKLDQNQGGAKPKQTTQSAADKNAAQEKITEMLAGRKANPQGGERPQEHQLLIILRLQIIRRQMLQEYLRHNRLG